MRLPLLMPTVLGRRVAAAASPVLVDSIIDGKGAGNPDDVLTLGMLATMTKGAAMGAWHLETNAESFAFVAADERPLPKIIMTRTGGITLSTTDTVRALKFRLDKTTNNARCLLPTQLWPNPSIACWIKTNTFGASYQSCDILQLDTESGGGYGVFYLRMQSDPPFVCGAHGNGGVGSTPFALAYDTWYIVHLQFQEDGLTRIRLLNSSLGLVGTDELATTISQPVKYFRFGRCDSHGSGGDDSDQPPDTSFLYLAGLMFDYTAGNFPLISA